MLRVWGLGFGDRIEGLGFRMGSLEPVVWGLGFGFRVSGSGFRLYVLGFRVKV